MVIYGVYIVSKSGGLIFNHDHIVPKVENEAVFNYPLNLKLAYENKKISVTFGRRDKINAGHVLSAVNGQPVVDCQLEDGRDVFDILNEEENFPITLKFVRPKMTTNEKIFLASMFYPLFAIASQLSPEPRCSGIEVIEADTFRLYCHQTLTGVKFIIIAEPTQTGVEILAKRVYELYSDFALKNPFYSLEMPIRCELFETNLQSLLEIADRTGFNNV